MDSINDKFLYEYLLIETSIRDFYSIIEGNPDNIEYFQKTLELYLELKKNYLSALGIDSTLPNEEIIAVIKYSDFDLYTRLNAHNSLICPAYKSIIGMKTLRESSDLIELLGCPLTYLNEDGNLKSIEQIDEEFNKYQNKIASLMFLKNISLQDYDNYHIELNRIHQYFVSIAMNELPIKERINVI